MQARDTLLIMTGGTIDAEEYPDPKNPPSDATPLENSLVPFAVAKLGHEARCNFLKWRAKDSKHYTAAEIEELAHIIQNSEAKYVVVTHGTDAMAENARKLKHLLKKTDKIVAVTGAMMPLANGKHSDGYDNLRCIFEHMEKWKPGVRVVIHEKSFDPIGLKKDFSTYTFQGRQISDTNVGSAASL